MKHKRFQQKIFFFRCKKIDLQIIMKEGSKEEDRQGAALYFIYKREKRMPCVMKCNAEVDLGFHVLCFVSVL